MNIKNVKIIANLIVAIFAIFSIFLLLVWTFMGIISLPLLFGIIYWRINVFPRVGIVSIVQIFIGGVVGTGIGLLIGWALCWLLWKLFSIQMHHGLAPLILFVSSLICGLMGSILGYLKYKKKVNINV